MFRGGWKSNNRLPQRCEVSSFRNFVSKKTLCLAEPHTDIWISGKMPTMIVRVIDRLAQMTIVKAQGTSLSHMGFLRVLIQCVVLYCT